MGRRRGGEHDSRKYYDWLDHAGEDMIAAELLLGDDRCYNGAAFHCQQAIEKALKSYILLQTEQLVDGHNLTWLCRKASQYDKKFRQWLDESANLNHCYIETRYPADIGKDLTYQEVRRFYTMAKDMFLFICKEVDMFLEKREAAARRERLKQSKIKK